MGYDCGSARFGRVADPALLWLLVSSASAGCDLYAQTKHDMLPVGGVHFVGHTSHVRMVEDHCRATQLFLHFTGDLQTDPRELLDV